MFDLKQLFKKEDGMCPICALPYVRGKRTLKASYLDVSYNVTAWTMRCEKCGYEVILPGTARIRTVTKEDEPAQDYCSRMEIAVFPDSGKAGAIIEPVLTEDEGMTEKKILLLEPPKELARYDEAGMEMPEADKTAETAESPEIPGTLEAPETEEAVGNPQSPDPSEPVESAESAKTAKPDETVEPTECVKDAEAEKTADDAVAGDTRDTREPKADKDMAKDSPEPATEEKDAEAVTKAADSKAGDSVSNSDKETEKQGTTKPEPVMPAASAPGKPGDGGQTAGKAEPDRPDSHVREVKAKPQGKAMTPEKAKGKAGQPMVGENGKNLDGQNRQKRPDSRKAPDGKTQISKTPAGAESKKQQKEAGSGHQKPAATPPSPAKPNPSGIAGGQPAPNRRQFGSFPGAGPSGFTGGSIFPSSAFSNLEAIRASIQTDADKKGSTGKGNGKGKQAPGPEPAKARQQEKTARKALSAENQAAKGAKDIKDKKGYQPDTGREAKPVVSADSKKRAGNVNERKTLSAENKEPEPGAAEPESASPTAPIVAEPDRKDGGGEKKPEKTLSAENGDHTGETPETGETKTTEPPKPDESRESQPHGKPENAASTLNKKSGSMEEKTESVPEKNAAEVSESHKQDPAGDKGNKEALGQEKPGKKKAGGDDMAKPENSRTTKDHKDPGEQKEAKEKKEPQDAKGQDIKEQAKETAKKISDKIPGNIIEKIPVLSQITKQQKRTIFINEEKKFLEQHVPHKQVIINDLIYDTDTSEMCLRVDGQYGLDNPCVHYNYRTQNGNFFRCTVKYKHEDSIRVLDIMEAKRMLEEYPDMYRKFFPDSVSDA